VLNGDFNDAQMLFVRERRALAGRSARHQEIDPRVNLPLN
jgi:hypothetical protein